MITTELLTRVKDLHTQGISESNITNVLLSEGFSDQDIASALSEAVSVATSVQAPTITPEHIKMDEVPDTKNEKTLEEKIYKKKVTNHLFFGQIAIAFAFSLYTSISSGSISNTLMADLMLLPILAPVFYITALVASRGASSTPSNFNKNVDLIVRIIISFLLSAVLLFAIVYAACAIMFSGWK